MECLYSIELQNGKFYVGKTSNFVHRMDQHVEGEGAHWCRTYGPMKGCTKHLESLDVTHEETKMTLQKMIDKGINNVRGAEYCQLAPFTEADARRMSYAAIHHLKRTDREHIEQTFKRHCSNTQSSPLVAQSATMGVSRNMYEPQYIETPAFKRARSLPFEIDSTFVLGGTLRSAPEPSNLVLSPLYRSLEAKRNEWAERSRTQPYKIFQNQTIEELSIKKPCTTEELLDIHGIGPVKLEQYGSQLLQVINAHLGNPSCVDCHTAVAPNKPRCLKCYRSMQKEVNNLRF